MPDWKVDGSKVETLEGMKRKVSMSLDPIQEAFATNFAQQCGYCTSAMILNAEALLDMNPNPSVDDIKDSLSGILCRCTGYMPIVEAVMQAGAMRRKNAPKT